VSNLGSYYCFLIHFLATGSKIHQYTPTDNFHCHTVGSGGASHLNRNGSKLSEQHLRMKDLNRFSNFFQVKDKPNLTIRKSAS
jgi:hypothetical protein